MTVTGWLRRTRRGYEEPPPPKTCPNGHPLRGPYRALVGSQQCSTCGVHRSFHCTTCDAVVFRPAAGPDCSFVNFDGRPAGHSDD